MASIIAGLTGLCAGIVAGSALCAFYVALGVFSKAAISLGIGHSRAMAVSSTGGILLGTIITLYDVCVPLGLFWAGLFGLSAGIFVGIFIACLAEVINAIPVLKNFGLANTAISGVLAAFVAGKLIGSLIYWLAGGF